MIKIEWGDDPYVPPKKHQRKGKVKSHFIVHTHLGKCRYDNDGIILECERYTEFIGEDIRHVEELFREVKYGTSSKGDPGNVP